VQYAQPAVGCEEAERASGISGSGFARDASISISIDQRVAILIVHAMRSQSHLLPFNKRQGQSPDTATP
jgi:hypothetical protein